MCRSKKIIGAALLGVGGGILLALLLGHPFLLLLLTAAAVGAGVILFRK